MKKSIPEENVLYFLSASYLYSLVIKLKWDILISTTLPFFKFSGPAFGPWKAAGHVQSHSKNSERMTPHPGKHTLVIQHHCFRRMDIDAAAFTGHWQVGLLWANHSPWVSEGRAFSLGGMIDIHLNRGLLAVRPPLPCCLMGQLWPCLDQPHCPQSAVSEAGPRL